MFFRGGWRFRGPREGGCNEGVLIGKLSEDNSVQGGVGVMAMYGVGPGGSVKPL